MPQITEEMGECVQDRTPELGISVPQFVEEIMEEGLHLVPQERVLKCTPEQLVDLPVFQIMEAIVENRFPEQLVDLPVFQIMEAIVENRFPEPLVDVPVPLITEAIVEDRFPEQLVDVPMPQIMEAIVEDCFPEQFVDVPVPQFMEAAVENRFPKRIVNSPEPQFVENIVGEQIADSPVPQFMGADVEIMHDAPQERMQTCTLEQTAAFPVPQISAERVPDRSPEQIMNFPVSQNMEAYAGRVRDIPWSACSIIPSCVRSASSWMIFCHCTRLRSRTRGKCSL